MSMNGRPAATRVAVSHSWLFTAAAALGLLALLTFFALRPATGTAAPAKSGAVVSTAQTGLGRILVSSSGHTLYMFGKDRNGRSSCSGQCASFWPPAHLGG
jgi:predicted lipoprotein with Yx(FWY)xxD motif